MWRKYKTEGDGPKGKTEDESDELFMLSNDKSSQVDGTALEYKNNYDARAVYFVHRKGEAAFLFLDCVGYENPLDVSLLSFDLKITFCNFNMQNKRGICIGSNILYNA
ncbi:hypothetical protein TNCV_3463841 [Trichonephila clavipes]|nr:hypothetical protein TNCV_3463841 [Trichonephila clavipes]